MAYSDFTLPDVQRQFGLTIRTGTDLFAGVPPVPANPAFRDRLRRSVNLATMLNTEKVRSEMLIFPVLGELLDRADGRISFYSGVDFDADPEAGLTGYCDYLFGRGLQLPYVTAPLLAVVEAKNESIIGGLGQCAAELDALRRFNEREGQPVDPVFGVVTTGELWRFLRLGGVELTVDVTQYNMLADLDRLLGVLLHVVGLNPIPTP